MNKLPITKRAQILNLLVEGNSLRATSRLTNVSYNTVLKFLPEIGQACLDYQYDTLRNLPCKRIEVDEIWSFCYAKNKNLTPELREAGYGDIWTWTSICPDTKIVPSWYIGGRNAGSANIFIRDLSTRFNHRIQLTSDGFGPYLNAVNEVYGVDVDYAQLVKIYGDTSSERYIGAERTVFVGKPDLKHISTSICERQNLTMRMSIRRFGRRTNAFSKKVENHAHAVAIHFMYYNFGRIHKTLRVTPAMEAGVTDHVWSLEEIVSLAK